ncbi:MAG: TonB-dependent receptor plug domain-containing protein, partial [Steroidobacteraceae bacterium]
MRLSVAAAAICLSIVGLAVADDVHASVRKPTNIPAQELGPALQRLAKERNFQIVYVSEEINAQRTPGAVGQFTSEEALKQLLKGTGLTFRYLDEKTVTIVPVVAIEPATTGTASPASPGSQSSSPTVAVGTQQQSSLWDRFRVAQVDQGASASAATAQEKSPVKAASEADATRLEEIVVTASKRTETIQNVPSAMTALTDQNLTNLAIIDFQDYLPYVPGLSSNPGGGGGFGNPGSYTVILRGLNTGSSQAAATVGYYLDDTPLTPSASNGTGAQFAPDPALGDVDRIEVLNGPQATLYGASTLGGIIKIVTKKPDLTTFSGDASVGGVTVDGGGTGYSTRGSVNIPLIQGLLAARVSAYDREDPGFTDNVFTGQTNVNLDHAHGGRLSLRYEPTQQLTIDLTGLIQQLYSRGGALEYLNPVTLQPIYG